jgi:hypothetical protein
MEQLKQHKALLLLVAVLAALKFVFVPLIAWQNQTYSEITQLQSRLDKSEHVIKQQSQIAEALLQREAKLAAYNQLIFPQQDIAAFRIERQKQLNETFAQAQVQQLNLGWLPAFKFEDAKLHREQVRLNLKGNAAQVLSLLVKLESQQPAVIVEQLDTYLRNVDSESLGEVEVTVLLSFFMDEVVS